MALADILPTVQKLSIFEKIRLIRILAEGIDSVQETDLMEDMSPLKPNQLYYLPTPYNSFGAGKILMDAMADSVSLDS